MKRDFRVYLDDILESIKRIQEYIKGKSKEDFNSNISLQDAVLRRLEIIGEAAKHIPIKIKQEHRDVPWKKITGARDIFAHEYFGVNFLINSTQFEKYPLRYQQGDCEIFGLPYPYPKITTDTRADGTISAEERMRQKLSCEKQQDLDRKQHKIEDLKNAITFTLVGLVLFLIHFPLARKQSR